VPRRAGGVAAALRNASSFNARSSACSPRSSRRRCGSVTAKTPTKAAAKKTPAKATTSKTTATKKTAKK